ncbi:hypothetical protein CEXT_182351 [Caerostris extrusa]|uniref:Uncharacterized protein n=1 Tax=Caerostris extrusa TaxID=172846 RepID=A0AAV4Y6V8_CAEEX|nr:hypothetical protein CEXT_182351 [Caerostris extrusa]
MVILTLSDIDAPNPILRQHMICSDKSILLLSNLGNHFFLKTKETTISIKDLLRTRPFEGNPSDRDFLLDQSSERFRSDSNSVNIKARQSRPDT